MKNPRICFNIKIHTRWSDPADQLRMKIRSLCLTPSLWCIIITFRLLRASDGASTSNRDGERQEPGRTLSVSGADQPSTSSNYLPTRVCTTDVCKETGKKFLDAIDPASDPCTDFYQYACGTWIANVRIPDDEVEIGQMTVLANKTLYDKIKMFANTTKNVTGSERKAREIYQQCLDTEQIERLRSQPILEQLQRFMGGWPIITPAWSPDKFDAFSVLAELQLLGTHPFVELVVIPMTNDSSKNVLAFGEAGTFTSIDIINSTDGSRFIEAYTSFMSNVTGQLFKDVQNEQELPLEELSEIMKTEIRLANVKASVADTSEDSEEMYIVTLGHLQENSTFQSVFFENFTQYVQNLFRAAGQLAIINNETNIYISNWDMLYFLDMLFAEYEKSGEGKRKMANYIGWQLISGWVTLLSSDYIAMTEEYARDVYGQPSRKETPRSEICVHRVTAFMPLAVGAMYVREYVPKSTREETITMVGNIKQHFHELLGSATWMDNLTRSKAAKKLNDMLLMAAYPEIMVTDWRGIDKHYDDIKLESTYFETYMKYVRSTWVDLFSRYAHTSPRYDPFRNTLDVTSINAYHLPGRNMIQIPAAILQSPYFDASGPDFMNYGGIGTVLGHEITHGFDNGGANHDENGNTRSWWSTKTYSLFGDKTRQMKWQYGNYSTPFGKVNGALTLGENIADNGGLKAAYRAYMSATRNGTTDPVLPGLESLSAEKLFFLSWAQVWCDKIRPEAERQQLLTEKHLPERFRINGPASNLPEFSRAFDCPAGSPMNPSVKSVVW